VKWIDAAAARQGKEADLLTQIPFKCTPVDVLIWVYLLAEKNRNTESGAFLVHKIPSYPFVISKNNVYTLLAGIDAVDGNRLPSHYNKKETEPLSTQTEDTVRSFRHGTPRLAERVMNSLPKEDRGRQDIHTSRR
jgi:hypothetical protein